jgi:hypothetical protein
MTGRRGRPGNLRADGGPASHFESTNDITTATITSA